VRTESAWATRAQHLGGGAVLCSPWVLQSATTADKTLRIAGRQTVARVHECLVEIAGAERVNQLRASVQLCASMRLPSCGRKSQPSNRPQDALHVSVDHGNGFSVRDAGDGRGRIGSMPGRSQFRRGCRESTVAPIDNKLRRL